MSDFESMNRDIFAAKWKQLKGRVRQYWGMLTDDDIEQIAGKREALIGALQEKYSYSRAEAEADIKSFLRGL